MNGVLKLKVFFFLLCSVVIVASEPEKNGTFLEIILQNCREVKVYYNRVPVC